MFTTVERSYLETQLLARLATLAPDSTLQNSPVGFYVNDEFNTVDDEGDWVIG